MTEDKLTESYQEFLLERLRDPAKAIAYLNAAIEEGDDDVFLLALRNVAESRQLLPPGFQFQWSDMASVLKALGVQLMIGEKRAA
ncbi:MAG: transcriptional regulator [Acidobacteriota bacterium]